MANFEIEVDGVSELAAQFLRLSAFQTLLRKPINAALGEAKRVMQGYVGSRKAKAAIKVYTVKTDTGIVGSVGPKGGKTRAGFLAARFLEIGTGLEGPKHQRLTPRSGGVMKIPTLSGAIVPSRELFTATGTMRAARAPRSGQVFATSTAGMKPRPWVDRSRRQAEPIVKDTFRKALYAEIHGGN